MAAVQISATVELKPQSAYGGSEFPPEFASEDHDFKSYRKRNSFPPLHLAKYAVASSYGFEEDWLWEAYQSGPPSTIFVTAMV